jgi:(p)ppGpp synthase/HD superfamily hydrolase
MPASEAAPTALLGPRFYDAVTYAGSLHGRQLRKGTTIPYLSHLLGVTAVVLEHGGDEDQAIAAMLHDAVEDQPRGGKTTEEIRARFGEQVLGLVLGLSDATEHPKPPWRERKERYVEHVRGATADELLISAADKLHNVRAICADLRRIGDDVWSRFKASQEEVSWYYHALIPAYRDAGFRAFIVDELERAVEEMDRLAQRSASIRPSR